MGCVFLQRRSDARRIYATVVHAKANVDGYKQQGITFPNGETQEMLLREVYCEAGVDPTDVEYVEAHGTGTKVFLRSNTQFMARWCHASERRFEGICSHMQAFFVRRSETLRKCPLCTTCFAKAGMGHFRSDPSKPTVVTPKVINAVSTD